MATTALASSFKQELLQGVHNFTGSSTLSGSITNGSSAVTGLSSTANLVVGMPATATGVQANTVIESITSASAITLSKTATATNAAASITFGGDTFNMLLIKASPARTFDGTQTNVGTPGSGTPGTANVGTDETSGSGYTSGGQALVNVTPSLSGSTAMASFSANPSWTSATFSTTAAIIYNTSNKAGAAATPINGRVVSVHDLGGTQSVSGGTLTLVLPAVTSSTALLRIS